MLTTVATYSLPYEAQIARAKLESEGIPAFVADEQTINMQWLYSDALGGVRVQVPSAYRERAVECLGIDETGLVEEQVGVDRLACEQCGSMDTETYQKGKRWAFLMFLLLKFPLFPVTNTYRCNACGFIGKK
jgi:hypothetical protein